MKQTLTTKYLRLYRLMGVSIWVILSACSTTKTPVSQQEVIPDFSKAALFYYDQDSVTAADFRYVYLKNNQDSLDRMNAAQLENSVRDYLELYINFKLKVAAAYKAGMDRDSVFLQEYAQYRDQLAKPYMVENRFKEELIQTAYERQSEEIHASHILITVPEGADTLRYYRKADSLRQLALDGASFAMLAEENSDDPSAAQNGGNLGYFTSLQMVYPFENAAYATPVGEISLPLRTRYGYHIIKVHDRRPSRGKVQIAHLMIRHSDEQPDDKSSPAYSQAMKIYEDLQQGADWDKMVERYSDDLSTRAEGGVLPPFGTGGMLPAIAETAFSLTEEGSIAEPVSTRYGWHLIRLMDRKELEPLESLRPMIDRKVRSILQSPEMQGEMLAMLKEENQFERYPANVAQVMLYLTSEPEAARPAETLGLFSIKDSVIRFSALDTYLSNEQIKLPLDSLDARQRLEQFEEDQIISFEEAHLTAKYPEFRRLAQEYKEGILLFNIMEQKIWAPANQDSEGLNAYYQQNREQYRWQPRVDATILRTGSEELRQDVINALAGKEPDETAIQALEERFNQDQTVVEIYQDVYEQGNERSGEEAVIDLVQWEEGEYQLQQDDQYYLVYIHNAMPSRYKNLEEVRGMVVADYQDQLDKNWVQTLRSKYPVRIDETVLNYLLEEIKQNNE